MRATTIPLRRTTRTYARLLLAGVRRQSTYRLAAFGGLVANTTFGLLKVAILFATVRAAGGELNGYDVGSMSAYIWISQGMLGSVNFNGRTDIAERIKDGQVVVDFLRPLDVQAASITTEVGQSLFALLPRGLPSVAIGILVVGMDLPSSAGGYLLGAVSLLLAIVVSATTVYLVAAAGFWLVETRGLQVLYMVVSGFLAGLFVPIDLFPTWLRLLAEGTPFPSMMMTPVAVLSGRTTGLDAVGLVGVQLLWLAGTALAGHLMTRAGRHRLEVQGG
ncbi:MAG: ABC transporter permease [Nocardioides sp.]